MRLIAPCTVWGRLMANPRWYCCWFLATTCTTTYSKVLDILMFFDELDSLQEQGLVPTCRIKDAGCIESISVALLKHGGIRLYLTFATSFLYYGILILVAAGLVLFSVAVIVALLRDSCAWTLRVAGRLLGCNTRVSEGEAALDSDTDTSRCGSARRAACCWPQEGSYWLSRLSANFRGCDRASADIVFALLGLGVFIAPLIKCFIIIWRVVAAVYIVYWNLWRGNPVQKPYWGSWVTLPETLLSGQFLWVLAAVDIYQGHRDPKLFQKVLVGGFSVMFAYLLCWKLCRGSGRGINEPTSGSPSRGGTGELAIVEPSGPATEVDVRVPASLEAGQAGAPFLADRG